MPMSEGTDTSKKIGGGKGRSIADIRSKYPDTKDRETLKVWHYHAIAKHDIYGYTWKEVGEIFDKSESYLSSLASSPAGKRFRAHIASLDPVEIAEVTMRAAVSEAAHDYMLALEWAKEARDYDAVHRMTRDLFKFAGAGEDSKAAARAAGGQTLVLNLDIGSLDTPQITTSYQEIEVEGEIIED